MPIVLLALLLAASSAQTQESSPPPLSPVLLCRVAIGRTAHGVYPLIQDYAIRSSYDQEPYDMAPAMSPTWWEIPLPGAIVTFDVDTRGMYLAIENLDQARPWIGDLLDLARVGPTLRDSRKAWGKPPRDAWHFDPTKADHRPADPEREVLATLKGYSVKAWITYREDDPTTLASVSFEPNWGRRTSFEACQDVTYPPVVVEQSRWEPVKRAFDDPSALPMLMSLEGLNIRDWIDLVEHFGFAWNSDYNVVHGHGLAFNVGSFIHRIEVDRAEGWPARAGLATDRPAACAERWTGEITIQAREAERFWTDEPRDWFEIVNEGKRLDPSRSLTSYIAAPHCASGDCVNGDGTFVWAEGCRFEGSLAAGEPRDGTLHLADGYTQTIGSPPIAEPSAIDEQAGSEFSRQDEAEYAEPEYAEAEVDAPTDDGSRGPWVCTFEHDIYGDDRQVTLEVLREENNGWLTLSGSWYEPGLEGKPTVYLSFTSDVQGNQREGEWHAGGLRGFVRMVECVQ